MDNRHAEPKIIELEEGWSVIQRGITMVKNFLEGPLEQLINTEEYTILYSTIYSMCMQNAPHNYSQQLYDRYKESFEEYINTMVLPALRGKQDEFMLTELVKRWDNHQIMVRWLSRFFMYLDRSSFIEQRRSRLPALKEVGWMCFRDQVYVEMKYTVKDAVITLIDRERAGEIIDRALLKNVIGIFVDIGMGSMAAYESDFELPMLTNTAAYYSGMAASWIEQDSIPDYILKVKDCLRKEKERVSHYLHASSEGKLLEKVQHELLSPFKNELLEKIQHAFFSECKNEVLEKGHSVCQALLIDDKAEEKDMHGEKKRVSALTFTFYFPFLNAARACDLDGCVLVKCTIAGGLSDVNLAQLFCVFAAEARTLASMGKAFEEAFMEISDKGIASSSSATFGENLSYASMEDTDTCYVLM